MKKSSHEPSHNQGPKIPDTLQIIFEHQLIHLEGTNIDQSQFVAKVVKEYLGFTCKTQGLIVPAIHEKEVVEEIGAEVQTMLLKRIYGYYSIEEYSKQLDEVFKTQAKNRYLALNQKKKLAK